GYGRGSNRTARVTENTAVFAPIASARVPMAIIENARCLERRRTESRRSLANVTITGLCGTCDASFAREQTWQAVGLTELPLRGYCSNSHSKARNRTPCDTFGVALES